MIEEYEQLVKSAKDLLKTAKAIEAANKNSVDYRDMTPSQIGKRSDMMTRLAFDRDKALENIHADLVDASLTKMKDSYDTVLVTHTHGCGSHNYTFKHTPKIPKKFTSVVK